MGWYECLRGGSDSRIEVIEDDFEVTNANTPLPVSLSDWDIILMYPLCLTTASGYFDFINIKIKDGIIPNLGNDTYRYGESIGSRYYPGGSDQPGKSATLSDLPTKLGMCYGVPAGTWHYIAIKFAKEK